MRFVLNCVVGGRGAEKYGRVQSGGRGALCFVVSCCNACAVPHPLQCIEVMYYALLSRLIAILMLCSLCLQGCRSNFRVTFEEPALKKLRKTSDDAQAASQDSVLLFSTLSSAPDSRLPTAVSATLPSMATSAVQMTSPTHHLAVKRDALPAWEEVSSTEYEEIDTKPAARLAVQVTEFASVGCLELLHESPPPVSTPVFGAQEWRRYFGEVGEDPSLPSDIDEILGGPCPFWPGKAVKDTHLLVLIPSTVSGKAFTLDLLGELVQHPRGGGHGTQYFLYDDEVQRSLGSAYSSSSYWVLLTRDVLPGSRGKPYAVQQALVAAQASRTGYPPYEMPHVLEVATAILSHYVCSGYRLDEGFLDDKTETLSTATYCAELLEDAAGRQSTVAVGHFCARGLVFLSGFDDDVEFGISCLRRFGTRKYRPSALLHSFGAEEWSRYFGEVGAAPPLPAHIVDTLNGPCPFWPGRAVKDTHLLVLIPATVAGEPFSLNLLGELVQHPRGGGRPIKYCFYGRDVQTALGAQSPAHSYWVLMTRDVLEGSRSKRYTAQNALVAARAGETGLPYVLPSALEVATVILSYYVRSGERLYTNNPWTDTRCQELIDNQYPVFVGGLSLRGLFIYVYYNDHHYIGVSSLRKL